MAQLHRVDRPVPTLDQPTCQALTFSLAVGSRVFGRRPGLIRGTDFRDVHNHTGSFGPLTHFNEVAQAYIDKPRFYQFSCRPDSLLCYGFVSWK